MDYEKKYKNALEWARQVMNGETGFIRKEVEEIFPELKESEDEKIRKELIDFVRSRLSGFSDCKRFTDWLEKQGEQKPFDYEHSNIQQKDFAPKVEPKFKNGQWIVWQDKCYKVNYNGCGYELVDQNGLSTSIGYRTIDENAHRWDITKDAKDGDVLSYRDGQWIFIYKKQVDDNLFNYYSLYSTIHKDLTIDDSAFTLLIDGVVPATKEQRDKLEKTMKEAGYEWDADKKELRKIELNEWVPKKGDVCKPKKGGNNIFLCDQNGIVFSFVEEMKNGYAGGEISISTLLKDYELVEPKDYNTFDISFNAKDSELQEASYYIPEGFHAEINGNKVIIKKGEQKPQRIISAEAKEALYDKPAWSEEDEKMKDAIYSCVDLHYDGLAKTSLLIWLKSLKDRVQPKQEWSEEDDGKKAAEEYRRYRESCGIKDPVMLNEIEEAYYQGTIRRKPQ